MAYERKMTRQTFWRHKDHWRKAKNLQILETRPIGPLHLFDFLLAVQEAVDDGFEVSIRNEHFPVEIMGTYSCVMAKFDYPEPVEPIVKELSEEEKALQEKFADQAGAALAEVPPEPAKRGRKPKNEQAPT